MLASATVRPWPSQRSSAPHLGKLVVLGKSIEAPGFTMGFKRDEEIFGQGEPADFVYKVVSGVVRLNRLLDDGRRQISAFHFAGDVFGLEIDAEHAASAEAVTDCEIALIKSQTLRKLAAQDSRTALELLELTSQDLARTREHLLLLGRKTAHERVATFLIDLADRQPAGKTVNVPMSRTDIADYLGLTIETVSRTMSQLEREGAIELPSCRQIALCDREMLSNMCA